MRFVKPADQNCSKTRTIDFFCVVCCDIISLCTDLRTGKKNIHSEILYTKFKVNGTNSSVKHFVRNGVMFDDDSKLNNKKLSEYGWIWQIVKYEIKKSWKNFWLKTYKINEQQKTLSVINGIESLI